jgi:hypothetical protein
MKQSNTMKKLLTLLFTIIFSPYIFSMNEKKELQPISEAFPYELKKMILLDLSKNVHKYVLKEMGNNKAQIASRVIFNVSLVNWDLYKELDKTRNDPITARTIITNVACNDWDNFDPCLAKHLTFPGAKKCLALSDQLYANDLTPDKIEELYNGGALINYQGIDKSYFVLSHWIVSPMGTNNMIKLLDLGANPNIPRKASRTDYPLETAIKKSSPDKIKIILKYNPQKNYDIWETALLYPYRDCIDLLIPDSTPDELNDGLECCIYSYYIPEIMQKFIAHGASSSKALKCSTKKLAHYAISQTNTQVKCFNFLCDQEAFNETALANLQSIHKLFGDMITKLENNNLEKK